MLPQGAGGGGEGFEVQKYGDGRVALIGSTYEVHPAPGRICYCNGRAVSSNKQPAENDRVWCRVLA